MVYAPELLVVVSVVILVAVFLTETFAPGTTPPCASVTAPVSVAPATCARSEGAKKSPRPKLNTTAIVTLKFISVPPLKIHRNSPLKNPELRSFRRLKIIPISGIVFRHTRLRAVGWQRYPYWASD